MKQRKYSTKPKAGGLLRLVFRFFGFGLLWLLFFRVIVIVVMRSVFNSLRTFKRFLLNTLGETFFGASNIDHLAPLVESTGGTGNVREAGSLTI